MKKKIVSLLVALTLVAISVLGSLAGFAATINKEAYPYVNNKIELKLDYETTGTTTDSISTYKIVKKGNFVIENGALSVVQAKSGSDVYFRYTNIAASIDNKALTYTVDNSANNTEITLGIKPFSSGTMTVVSGAKYYRISGTTYEELDYNSTGEVKIPAGGKVTIVVPFENFTVGGYELYPTNVTGVLVGLNSIPVDKSKKIKFDNFGYIGKEYQNGEIPASEFPYTMENRWNEYDFAALPSLTLKGNVDADNISVSEGSLKLNLSNANVGDGFALGLTKTYSNKYDAAYFSVDNRSTSNVKFEAVWAINGNTVEIKNGGDYYYKTSEGLYFKKKAPAEGVLEIPAGMSVDVAVPYESLVLSNTQTGAGKPTITGVTLTFASDATDSSRNIYFNNFGYVKKFDNSFIIPPLMTGTLVNKNNVIVDMDREIKVVNDGTITVASMTGGQAGVDERDISYAGGRIGIPVSGNPKFKWTLSSSMIYQGISFDIDASNSPVAVNLLLQFTEGTSSGVVGKGKVYFLYNQVDGNYYKYVQTETDGTLVLPQNFKGKIIIPFESLKGVSTSVNLSINITLKELNGTDKTRFIWFDNLIQHRTDDNIGDKAYKIETSVANIREEHKMDSDESPESPMDTAYWMYAHSEYFLNSFTTDGAYSYTGQKMIAVKDVKGDVNCWGATFAGSWTCTGRNALMVYIDASNAPNMDFKPLFFVSRYKKIVTEENGEKVTKPVSMGSYTITKDSNVLLYNERTGKSKLATVSGNRLLLDGYKGWVIFPLSGLVPTGTSNQGSFEEISLVRSIGMQMMIKGFNEGDYVVFDESRMVLLQAPSVTKTWIPTIGYIEGDDIKDPNVILAQGGIPTGNTAVDTATVAALVGITALGFGVYTFKKRKKHKGN